MSPALQVLTASEDQRIKGDGWYSLLTDVLTTTENTPPHTLKSLKYPPLDVCKLHLLYKTQYLLKSKATISETSL